MSKQATVLVEAQPGRTVPFHPSVFAAPGGHGAVLKPGEQAEVKNTMEVRRAIRSGDLKIVEAKDAKRVTSTSTARTAQKGE